MKINIKICGPSNPVQVLGNFFIKILKKQGFYLFAWPEINKTKNYNTYFICISNNEAPLGINLKNQILIALDSKAFTREYAKVNSQGIIFTTKYKKNPIFDKEITNKNITLFNISKENKKINIMGDYLSLIAAASKYLGIDKITIKESFIAATKNKSLTIKSQHLKDIELGLKQAENIPGLSDTYYISTKNTDSNLLLNGSKAIAISLFKNNCDTIFTTKDSLQTDLLIYLKKLSIHYDLKIFPSLLTENAGGNALGYNLGEKKSLLISESSNIAGIHKIIKNSYVSETPLVILLLEDINICKQTNVVRQENFLNIYYSDFDTNSLLIFTPGDLNDLSESIDQAFDLSSFFQLPCVIITDNYLLHQTTLVNTKAIQKKNKIELKEKKTKPNSNYLRYQITKQGISPLIPLGKSNVPYKVNFLEHNEKGNNIASPEARVKMVNKRINKFSKLKQTTDNPTLYGSPKATISLISTGSNKGTILEALKDINQNKIKVNYIHFNQLKPFKKELLKKLVQQGNTFATIENNQTGQLTKIIQQHVKIPVGKKILKYNGRPFFTDELF